jgi:CO/xanthine dehydrogenase FAD-binding subunit
MSAGPVTLTPAVRPPSFAYVRARSLDDVFGLLAEHGTNARILAGGSDLLVRVRLGHARPTVVIDVKRVPELSNEIAVSTNTVRFGARVVMTDIIANPYVQKHFPALVQAARVVGSVQIRNRATLVGNACNASPAADTVPVLLAHDARVEARRRDGRVRTISMREFATGPGRTVLGADEIVTAIEIPVPAVATGDSFQRLTRRRGVDLAVVNAAAVVTADGRARVALGAVGPTIFVAEDKTGTLARADATEAERDKAIAAITSQARPRTDVRGGADYRDAMIAVLVSRAVDEAHARLAEARRR